MAVSRMFGGSVGVMLACISGFMVCCRFMIVVIVVIGFYAENDRQPGTKYDEAEKKSGDPGKGLVDSPSHERLHLEIDFLELYLKMEPDPIYPWAGITRRCPGD